MQLDDQYQNNRFFKNDQNNFLKLRNLVISKPLIYTKILLAKSFSDKKLIEWIWNCSKQFKVIPKTFKEIIQWILTDRTNYPKCQNPNCQKVITKVQGNGQYAKHCCRKCSGEDPNTKLIRERSCLKLFGTTNVFSSEYGKQKIMEGCLRNLGVPFSGMSEIKKQHTVESNLKKYGVQNVNQVPEIKARGTNTAMKNNGQLFNYCKYKFDNRKFDSSWELMYYIYLKDHKIQFEYHKPNLSFVYYVNGYKKHYYPDFVVENEIQEIKGSQFFNDKNEPYDCQHKLWWREKYQCMIDNNIKILRENDLKYVFEYIDLQYGRKSLQQYQICKSKIKP